MHISVDASERHTRRIAAYLILAVVIVVHAYLITRTFTQDSDGTFRSSVAGYGDIPFHLTQISKFGLGHWDIQEPIFEGTRLRYAFGINLISGMLLRATGWWVWSVHLPAVLMMAAATTLMFLIFRRFVGNRTWAAVAVVILFLFGSGLGANVYISKAMQDSMGPAQFIQYLADNSISTINKWNAVWPQQNIAWGAPLSLVLLHQRAFLAGIFLFSLFVWLLVENPKLEEKKKHIAAGVVLGLMPLMHYHSFIAAGVIGALFLLWHMKEGRRAVAKRMFWLLIIAAVIALPQVLYLVTGKDNILGGSAPFLTVRLGWMWHQTIGSATFPPEASFFGQLTSYLRFLWVNFGVVLPLTLAALSISWWRADVRRRLPWMLPSAIFAFAFFVLTQVVRFQPWDYDNNKILVYFQFFAAPAIAGLFIVTGEWKKWIGVAAWSILFPLCIYSGVIDQLPRLAVKAYRQPVIFNIDARAMAEYIRANVPDSDVIATTSSHLNPVDSLAGHVVLVGYPGWLWTRGINYSVRENDLKNLYSNPAGNTDILRKYDIRYILLDPSVRNDWHADDAVLSSLFRVVHTDGAYTLYAVH